MKSMKRILWLLVLGLVTNIARGQNAADYNPPSPADPGESYRLTIECTPKSGGIVQPGGKRLVPAGERVDCHIQEKAGYTFSQWMIGDSVVSVDKNFCLTMPHKDVVLIAHLDMTGYNPVNPDDPFAEGYMHKVSLYSAPSVGGYFNSSCLMLKEGESANVYAYPHSGYKFASWKKDGKIVSTSNPLPVTMGEEPLAYTATFVYSPANPVSPSANNFNATTGELVMDAFEPGELNNAIWTVLKGEEDYSRVKSVKIVGRMDNGDFGFSQMLTNCTSIDLARASCYTEVPQFSFEGAHSLEKVVLPSSVEKICANAFIGCVNMKTLVSYALVPPVLEQGAFSGVHSDFSVSVLSSALSQYLKADGWKTFPMSVMDGNTHTLTVDLPKDAMDGRYKNMTIELDNISSGQISKCLITDRKKYSFVNLLSDTKYNVLVRNESSVLGTISDIHVKDKDVNVAFASLLMPKDVSLVLQDSGGVDISGKANIEWYGENANFLCDGNVLHGVVPGTKVKYKVALSAEDSWNYVVPKDSFYVVSDDSVAFVKLSPRKSVMAFGRVYDAASYMGLPGVSVTVSQSIDGKNSKTDMLTTNSDGGFSVPVVSMPFSVSYSMAGYETQVVTCDERCEGQDSISLPNIRLKSVADATILMSLKFYESTLEGAAESRGIDYNDISYALYDVASKKEITNFSNCGTHLIIYDKLAYGDSLVLKVQSRSGCFADVERRLLYVGTAMRTDVPLQQYGGFQASYGTSDNDKVTGMLFDNKGNLMGTREYGDANSLSWTSLEDGEYTLVTMQTNNLYNKISRLSHLAEIGFVRDVDYLATDIAVSCGLIKNVELDAVPVLDTAKLKFLDTASLRLSDISVVAGNYVTVTSDIGFAVFHGVDSYDFIVELMDGMKFLDGSLMVGDKVTKDYTVSGNRLQVPVPHVTGKNDKIRFCVVPYTVGHFTINSLVRFHIDGTEKVCSGGGAEFETKELTINAPKFSVDGQITVRGTCRPYSVIDVYDGDVVIAHTKALAGGEWKVECELSDAYNLSTHRVWAKLTDTEGNVLASAVEKCFVDKNRIHPVLVNMQFYNSELGRQVNVWFDQEKGTVSPASYSMMTGETFSFVVDLGVNAPKWTSSVFVYVLTSDNKVTRLPASYVETLDRWVASSRFYDRNTPVNVSVQCFSTTSLEVERSSIRKDLDQLSDLLNKQSDLDALVEQLENACASADTAQCNSICQQVEGLLGINPEAVEDTGETFEDFYENTLEEMEQVGNWTMNMTDTVHTEFPDGTWMVQESGSISDLSYDLSAYICDTLAVSDSTKLYLYALDEEVVVVDSAANMWYRMEIKRGEKADTRQRLAFAKANGNSDMEQINNVRAEVGALANNLLIELANFGANVVGIGDNVNQLAFFLENGNRIGVLQEGWGDFLVTRSRLLEQQRDMIMRRLMLSGKWRLRIKQNADYFANINLQVNGLRRLSSMLKFLGPLAGTVGITLQLRDLHEQSEENHTMVQELDRCDNIILSRTAWNDCKSKEGEWLNLGAEYRRFRKQSFNKLRNNYVANVLSTLGAISSTLLSLTTKNPAPSLYVGSASTIIGSVAVVKDAWDKRNISNKIGEYDYRSHNLWMKKCEDEEDTGYIAEGAKGTVLDVDEAPAPQTPNVRPIYDPAGFVYEAVESNRIEGVKATCFYQETKENMYGEIVKEPVLWNASEYGQKNPLYTNSEGRYRWDVPQGLWQVKFEKEGYETSYSDWLPVPPPQLEVNVTMVQTKQPEVKSVHAYQSGIVVEFDKYMQPQYLTTDNIYVVCDGQYVDGQIQMLDQESPYGNEDEVYVSKVRFVPELMLDGDSVTIVVSQKVKSYADVQMQSDYVQSLDLEKEIEWLRADSVVNVRSGGTRVITLKGSPASVVAGRTVSMETTSSSIAWLESDTVQLDDNGEAEMLIHGGILGTAAVAFAFDGYGISTTTVVNVTDEIPLVAEKPKASIPSGTTLPQGSELYLSCRTEGAAIYYTIDGSCPCDEATRILYDGSPIIITDSVIVRAIAVAPGMKESEVAEFHYYVDRSTGVGNATSCMRVQVSPIPVEDELTVTAEGRIIKSVVVTSVGGAVVASCFEESAVMALDVRGLAPGVYFVVVRTEEGRFVQRIVKA